jgi:formate hydrogenlyase transcriptional activator
MPSLRERLEDIPLLVTYLTQRYATKMGKKIERIDKKTLERLKTYHWPGNVRELQNVVERALILCEDGTFAVGENWLDQAPLRPASRGALASLADQEKEMIENALTDSHGKVSGPLGAAARLGIARSTLESRIKSLEINKHRFRSA